METIQALWAHIKPRKSIAAGDISGAIMTQAVSLQPLHITTSTHFPVLRHEKRLPTAQWVESDATVAVNEVACPVGMG